MNNVRVSRRVVSNPICHCRFHLVILLVASAHCYNTAQHYNPRFINDCKMFAHKNIMKRTWAECSMNSDGRKITAINCN